jgi:hypothetical protein
MEPDLASGSVRCRRQERLQLSVDIPQDGVVDQKFSVDRSQPLQDAGPAREFFTHAQKRANDEYAHLNSVRAVEDVGCHERTMFRNGPGRISAATAAGF